MRFTLLTLLLALCVGILANGGEGGDDDYDKHHCRHRRNGGGGGGGDDDDWDEEHHRCKTHGSGTVITVHGVITAGTPYAPSPIGPEPDDDEPSPPLPNPPGSMLPSSPAIDLVLLTGGNNGTNQTVPRRKRDNCEGPGIIFDESTVFQSDTQISATPAKGSPAEPNGARHGNVVFTTSNWAAQISIDGGFTFTTIDPTTYAGPGTLGVNGGFCCDQVVQYVPSIDRFIWLLQYATDNSTGPSLNKLRLITFHPSDVAATKINNWLYTDFLSTVTGAGGWLDYGELSVGNSQLYLSATWYGQTGSGLTVMQIPLNALNVVGGYTYSSTHWQDGGFAQGSRISQNGGDAVFWAGHVSNNPSTSMRVFKWSEGASNYAWNDLTIDPWPTNTTNFVSNCPGTKTNWLYINSANNIIGSTRFSENEVWFAWNANSGGGFVNPHIQIVQVNVANFPTITKAKQWQIWNPNFAFAFPNFYTSTECGDVGLAVVFGGNTQNPSSALGVITQEGVLTQTVYYPELSDTCELRIGDYLGVRSDNGVGFEGFVYAIQSAGGGAVSRNSRFVAFGRG